MPKTLYERLADSLSEQIQAGVYVAGEKLPSIRQLSRQQKVSIPTIQQAYNLLEDQRLIEARPKSGYYVKYTKPSPSTPLERSNRLGLPSPVLVHDLAMQVFKHCEHQNVLNLGTAYPSAEFLPQAALQRIAGRLLRERMPELVSTHFSPGDSGLRHQIAQRMAESGCCVNEQQIIVTNGCQEALNLCLRAVAQAGDTIAIETPSFIGLLQAIEAAGMRALEIPTHPEQGISLDALELALEQWPIKAVALVPAFSNPLGANMPEANKQRLVNLLSERQVPLIEDDLFGDLAFNGFRIKPAKAFDTQDWVLYCSSVSKSIAPGFRVGWISPGRYQQKIEFLKSFTNVSAPALAQLTVAAFLASGAYDRHLRQLRQQFRQQLHSIRELLIAHFPADTWISNPSGGYILWLKLAANVDSLHFHQQALAQGIGIVPGQLCSPTGKHNQCIRINCAVPFTARLEQAIRQLGDLAKTLAHT